MLATIAALTSHYYYHYYRYSIVARTYALATYAPYICANMARA